MRKSQTGRKQISSNRAKKGDNLLSPAELRFVLNFKGDQTEAARAAGYSNPKVTGCRLMDRERVQKAVKAVQDNALAAAGRKLGNKLSKTDLLDEAMKLAKLSPEKTNNTITGQVSALKLIAEVERFIVRQTQDITKEAQGKTEAEMEFFCVNRYWPTRLDLEREQSSSAGRGGQTSNVHRTN